MRRVLPVLALLMVFLVAAAGAADLRSEVSWIKGVKGVSLTVDESSSSDRLHQSYMVQDPERVLGDVREGLKQRGWTLTGRADLGGASYGASVRTLKAEKAGMSLKISLQDAGIVATMDVDVRGGGSSSQAPSGGAPASAGKAAGAELTFNDSHESGVYACNGTEITINGSHHELRFTGRCKSLTINGGHNKVIMEASCPEISINGSWNRVSWSAKANPGGPDVSDLGMDNEVVRLP